MFHLWMRAQGKSRFRRIDVHEVLLSVGRHDQTIQNGTIDAATLVLGQCGVVWCGSADSEIEDELVVLSACDSYSKGLRFH